MAVVYLHVYKNYFPAIGWEGMDRHKSDIAALRLGSGHYLREDQELLMEKDKKEGQSIHSALLRLKFISKPHHLEIVIVSEAQNPGFSMSLGPYPV